ncbi:FGGY family carbohydrate kinase [Pseudomonas entomophila]|uniref:xylulokinase n=1 Tax=Pseudomonas entomophila TaxID=312306 RepID=UPI0023D874FB|nr:FGGY family carbohydrate kinase [Pseudomonas entomophila]MDF0732075.1 FGGY family carbohydrate kinase [Pseudomonas entomophila]
MSRQTIVVGVDLGTSSTRAVALDAQGTLRGAACMGAVPVGRRSRPDGAREGFLDRALAAARQALDEARASPGQVAGIAVCGQMAGLCAVDAQGRAMVSGDSWLDLDCAAYLGPLRAHEADIVRRSGSQLIASQGARWLQIRETQPALYRRLCKLTTPSALVAGRLAGLAGEQAFIDTTHLGFNAFADVTAGTWNLALVRALGLEVGQLPRIVEPWEHIGGLTAEFAGLLGLRQGTPVFAGCGDVAATLLGSGVFERGQLVDIAGTGSVFCAVRGDFAVDQRQRTLLTLRHCLPGLYYSAGYVGGGGLNRDWLESLRAEAWPPHDISAALREPTPVPPLLFLPHMGGRHLPLAADLRGAFVGLTWQHGLADLQRAMVEATAYEYAGFLDAMRDTGLTPLEGGVLVVGGGASSEVFNQIKADVLGLPYRRHGAFEAAALGAALLAGQGAGVFDDLPEVACQVAGTVSGVSVPDARRHGLYRQRLVVQRQMVAALQPVFGEMAQLPWM